MDYVVLLHGISRTQRVMRNMAQYLEDKGYAVYNDHYKSTSFVIETLVDHIYERVKLNCPDSQKTIHFVGHSMGAIIIRCLIAKYRPQPLGRVVMLAPPNHGSHLVDFMKRFSFYRRLYGPAGQQLGTDNAGVINRLPPIDYDVGIIAGDRSIDLLFSWFILSGKNDGKITVEETKLDGMQDHIVLPATHTFMPSNSKVIKQTAHFLKDGRFFRE